VSGEANLTTKRSALSQRAVENSLAERQSLVVDRWAAAQSKTVTAA
jgi:hypothetical protein